MANLAFIEQPVASKTEKIASDSNLRFWAQLRETPDSAKTTIIGGRLKGKTDIQPVFRYKRLTEVFGPCGIGWVPQNIKFETPFIPNCPEVPCICTLELIVRDPLTKEWSLPIPGVGGSKLYVREDKGMYLNDEAYKMAETDAMSVACKYLGVSADVYYSKDRTKYVFDAEVAANAHVQEASGKPTRAEVVGLINSLKEEIEKKYGSSSLFDSARAILIAEGKVSSKGAFELTGDELDDMLNKIRAKVEEGACAK